MRVLLGLIIGMSLIGTSLADGFVGNGSESILDSEIATQVTKPVSNGEGIHLHQCNLTFNGTVNVYN